MAVKLVTTIQRWDGLSTDTKPSSGVSNGSTFNETDTGKVFRYDSQGWVRDLSGPVSVSDFNETEALKRRLAEAEYLKPQEIDDSGGHYNILNLR